MRILEHARELLGHNGYQVSMEANDRQPQLLFENLSVFGFVVDFGSTQELVAGWAATQEQFLRRYSRALQLHPTKAWNAYGVFLTAEKGNPVATSQLGAIEEDFNATRKIARAGVATSDDVRRALAPLLTVSHARVLEGVNVEKRVGSLLPPALRSALIDDQSPQLIADLLEEEG